jgi:hypothetical protein
MIKADQLRLGTSRPPHGALELSRFLHVQDRPSILARAPQTKDRTTFLNEALRHQEPDEQQDLILPGSWGRPERLARRSLAMSCSNLRVVSASPLIIQFCAPLDMRSSNVKPFSRYARACSPSGSIGRNQAEDRHLPCCWRTRVMRSRRTFLMAPAQSPGDGW